MARPQNIPFSEENATSNYAEFSVTKKADSKIILTRILFLALYLLFAVAYCTVFLVLTKMAPVVAILPLLLFVLWLLTWKFTKIEYLYIVCQGHIHIYRINGYNKAKEMFSAKISENDGIYPVSDEEYASFAKSCAKALDFSAGQNTEDRYFARFSLNGVMTAVYFTAATKLLSTLRYYGGEKVVVTYVSH